MNSGTAKDLIQKDFARYGIGQPFGIFAFLKFYFFKVTPGVKFSMVFRLCQHYRYKNRLLFYLFYLLLKRVKYRYGFDISYRTTIGGGLYIGHFGGIVIHGDTKIGENCNLSQGMTIGVLVRGNAIGIPKIGNRVFIGPGAVLLGGITIGDDVLIGTNAIVNFDVPHHAVVASPLAQIISDKGSNGYIVNISKSD